MAIADEWEVGWVSLLQTMKKNIECKWEWDWECESEVKGNDQSERYI